MVYTVVPLKKKKKEKENFFLLPAAKKKTPPAIQKWAFEALLKHHKLSLAQGSK